MIKALTAGLCFFLPSAPTRVLYRLCGHRIGKRVRMPALSYIHARHITLGPDVDIRRFVFIRLGKALTLGAKTIVSYGCQIKGEASFTCGDNCMVGIHSVIQCAEDVSLGFYSSLGPRCTVYAHGSFLPVTMGYPVKFAPVVIEDFVWAAMNVTIMPGAHIERNCLINPGVVVNARIKADSFIQMNPLQYAVNDLARLQKLRRKSVPAYHHQIITSFLEARSLPFQHQAERSRYEVPGRFAFISHPDDNRLELIFANDRKIGYDLDRFTAEHGRQAVHKDFLAFIRFRFGIILRTQTGEAFREGAGPERNLKE